MQRVIKYWGVHKDVLMHVHHVYISMMQPVTIDQKILVVRGFREIYCSHGQAPNVFSCLMSNIKTSNTDGIKNATRTDGALMNFIKFISAPSVTRLVV